MKIARNDTRTAYGAGWDVPDGIVSFAGHPDRAERCHRHIIDALYTVDAPAEVNEILDKHAFELDAMMLDYPDYLDAVTTAADDVKAMLAAPQLPSGAPVTARPFSTKQRNLFKMFATNQTEGSMGPWITWTSNGSAAKQFPPKSWVIRGKDDHDQKYENIIEGFANPCVFDLESLKLGWEKDGAQGQAPERRYSSHYSVPMERPDESKKPNGAFTWSNCLQVRVAISPTMAVTWEQGSFGAYQAFTKLAKLIEAQWQEHSNNGMLLPVVQQTGIEERSLSSGSTNIPILTIVKWAPRPDVLKDDAPTIATQPPAATPPAAAPQPAPQPAPAPTNAAPVPGEATF